MCSTAAKCNSTMPSCPKVQGTGQAREQKEDTVIKFREASINQDGYKTANKTASLFHLKLTATRSAKGMCSLLALNAFASLSLLEKTTYTCPKPSN